MGIEKGPREQKEINLSGRFLELKRKIAGVLTGSFLFFPGLRGVDTASEFYSELKGSKEQVLLSSQNLTEAIGRIILTSQFFQRHKEGQVISIDAYELTKSLNDLKAIEEFLKPNSYFSFDDFYGLTIDIPSRYNFANLVKAETKLLFQEGAKMKFLSGGTIRDLARQKREELALKKETKIPNLYELKIFVRVRRELERSILLGYFEEFLRTRGITRDTLEGRALIQSIENLLTRIAVMAEVKIEIKNLETGESLTLIGFGVPKRVGIPLDDLAFKEAISNAYQNLLKVLQEALKTEGSFYPVFLVLQV